MRNATLALIASIALAAPIASAAPGSLDVHFGGGKVLTSFGASSQSGARALAMQHDGRVLAGGYRSDGAFAQVAALARFNPDGTLDPTFGTGGKLVEPTLAAIAGIAVAPGGAITVVGTDCRVARLTAAGSLDATFGSSGLATPPGCMYASGLVRDSAGRILVIGRSSNGLSHSAAVYRLTANGAIDLSFNGTGVSGVGGAFGSISVSPVALALSPSGKIVALSSKYISGVGLNRAIIEVARLNDDGTADTTFGTGCCVSTMISPPDENLRGPLDFGHAIAVDAAERVVVVGAANSRSPLDLFILRYTATGVLDTSFNGTGFVKRAIGPGGSSANAVVLQDDGKIIAAGSAHNGTRYEMAIVRYLADGTPDATFGNAGLVTFGFTGDASVSDVVLGNLELGGEILVAGSADEGAGPTFMIAALEGDDPPRMYGVSTRAQVEQGDDVLIGGFIVGGSLPKTVMVRARGPSLGMRGALADPVLTLVPASGGAVLVNDDWQADPNAATVAATGYQPSDPRESALLRSLAPGAYTAIVSGSGGATGLAIVEIYEIDRPDAPLIGISTRGRVQTADAVMIGGFIIEGDGPRTVVVRARGPSLGLAGALLDPVLALVPANGGAILTNDNWQTDSAAAALLASGFAPGDPNEAALLVTLSPGAYTAIVSGASGTTGVAIVEVYPVGP